MVQRLIQSRSIQAKLRIGQPNDKYEQKADRIADQVMRMPDSAVQRKTECTSCSEEKIIQSKLKGNQLYPMIHFLSGGDRRSFDEEKGKAIEIGSQQNKINRMTTKGNGKESSNQSDSKLRSKRILTEDELSSGGPPLPQNLLNFYESRFNRNLGSVRFHSGPRAKNICANFNAHAITYGRHIWLG